jgi:hypothetical protein
MTKADSFQDRLRRKGHEQVLLASGVCYIKGRAVGEISDDQPHLPQEQETQAFNRLFALYNSLGHPEIEKEGAEEQSRAQVEHRFEASLRQPVRIRVRGDVQRAD